MAESAPKKRKPLNRLTSFALGTAFAVGDVIDESVTAAANVTKGALQVADAVTAPVRKPLDKLGVTDLVTAPLEAVGDTVEAGFERLETRGRGHDQRLRRGCDDPALHLRHRRADPVRARHRI